MTGESQVQGWVGGFHSSDPNSATLGTILYSEEKAVGAAGLHALSQEQAHF